MVDSLRMIPMQEPYGHQVAEQAMLKQQADSPDERICPIQVDLHHPIRKTVQRP
ncbi:MAG: hypothetical protein ABFS39_06050 [Pseudomonadota bacterium]